MRHPRLSVSAVLTLIVAMVMTGATFVSARPHDNRRRPVRVVRSGVQRLDSVDAVNHETDQHDPVSAPSTEGLTGRPVAMAAGLDRPARPEVQIEAVSQHAFSAPIHAFPPGLDVRAFDILGDVQAGVAVITPPPILPPSSATRPALGRAPPAL